MSCEKPGCNNPEGDSIYLLDNLGISTKCTKSSKDSSKYICDNIVFGKKPVYTVSDDIKKCGFSLCDVNIFTGETKLDSCRNVNFPYYLDGGDCQMINSKCLQDTGIFADCCDGSRKACKSNGRELDNTFRIQVGDFQGTRPFTCDGTKCIQIPPTFNIVEPEKSKDRYPEIYKAIMYSDTKYGNGGVFYSNNCNCVEDRDDCQNNSVCKPIFGCKACNYIGKYYCDLEEKKCIPTTKDKLGTFSDISSCEKECQDIKKYSCVNGECKQDDNGEYIGINSCIDGCKSIDTRTFAGKNLLRIITISGVIIIGIVLLIILFVIIIKIYQKVKAK